VSLPDKVAFNFSTCVSPLREKERERSALFVNLSACVLSVREKKRYISALFANLSACVLSMREKKRYISALLAVKLSLSSLPFVVKTVKDREVL